MGLISAGIYSILFSLLLFLLLTRVKNRRDSLLEEEKGLKAHLHDYCDVTIPVKESGDFRTSFRTARVSIYDGFFVISWLEKMLVPGESIIKVELRNNFLSAKYVVVFFENNSLNKEVFIYTFFPERMLTCIKNLMDRCGEKK